MNKITVACSLVYKGSLLLITELVNNKVVLDIPAGGIKSGEDIESAIVREVFEETGVKINSPELVAVFQYKESTETTINFLYKIELKHKPHLTSQNQEIDEDIINLELLSLEEIDKMLIEQPESFEHELARNRLSYLIKGQSVGYSPLHFKSIIV